MNKNSKWIIFGGAAVVAAVVLLLVLFDRATPPKVAYHNPQHDKPQRLFIDPVNVEVVETTADALTTWREYSDVKPTLVIFSTKTLMPVPADVRDDLSELLDTADKDEVRALTARPSRPDTLLRPEMAVAAGLLEGYFSQVVWVVSVQEKSELQFEGFMELFRQRAEAWGANFETFGVESGHIAGTLAGVPVEVVTVEQLPDLAGPIVFHFDASYLLPLYKGEIKTPIFDLLRSQAEMLAARDYQAWAATVSRDTLTGDVPLDARFFADEMARFIAKPEMLKVTTEDEQLWRQALYLVNFFKSEMIYEDYQKLKKLRPQDAAVLFGEYKVLRDLHQPDQALHSLAQAVALDPVYAYEYLALADLAMEKQLVDKALKQIDQAIAALPDEPFIQLRKAQLLLSVGRDDAARPILEKLRDLPWSKRYYQEVRTEIERLF